MLDHFIVGEVWPRRTANTKTYLLADGSFRHDLYSHDIHYEDQHGNLQNVEIRLHDEAEFDLLDFPVAADGVDMFERKVTQIREFKRVNNLDRDLCSFQALKLPFAVKIPRVWQKGYTIGKDETRLQFIPVDASPAVGALDRDTKNRVRYQDAFNDTDVWLDLSDKGIKETLILKTDRAPRTFTFRVVGELADDMTAGLLRLEPAWLEDAEKNRRDVAMTMRREGDETYLDLAADVDGLVYPVVIDPTVSLPSTSNVADAYVASGTSAGSNFGSSTTLSIGASGYNPNYQTFIKFDLSSIPTNAKISSATITTTQIGGSMPSNYSYGSSAYPCKASWTESGITWNNKPAYDTSVTSSSIAAFQGNSSYWGTSTLSVTDSVKYWIEQGHPNYGWCCFIDFTDSVYGAIASKEHATAAYRPSMSVTYNLPPSAPTLTYPVGGETLNAQHTVTWNPATDSDTAQSALQYEISLSTDNGSTWKTIVALTQAGVTSAVYDFTNEVQSSTCLIRIRAYDGALYGPYSTSAGVFTIQHNQAPTAPTNLAPSAVAVDRGAVVRLSWKHNDPNGDPQAKFDLQWRQKGSATWNTITQTTVNQFYDMSAGTLPHGDIEWQVRTYDQAGLSGPYSAQATFTAGDKSIAPTITTPATGATVGVSRPTLQWSSPDQIWYQVQALSSANAVLWDSQPQNNTNKAQTILYDLANNTTAKLQVRIKNADGLWTDWAVVQITISYTPPAVAALTVTPGSGYLRLSIANPAPTGTQPSVAGNDLYRRKAGETAWTRIAAGLPNNGSYNDYAVRSATTYEYKVVSLGANTTITESSASSGSVTLSGIWLHAVTDPSGTAHCFKLFTDRNASWKQEAASLQFDGRTDDVWYFGAHQQNKVSFKLDTLKSADDLTLLRSLVQRCGIICYRDARGRKIFGVITELPETDQAYGYSVPVTIQSASYQEAV